MATLVDCPTCGKSLSSDATACPHCGQPRGRPAKRKRGGLWWRIPLAMIALTIVAEVLTELSGGDPILPACGSSDGEEKVKGMMQDAPMGKVLGLSIIRFDDVRVLYSSAKLVECSANVTLNNATTQPFKYKFYVKDAATYIEGRFDE